MYNKASLAIILTLLLTVSIQKSELHAQQRKGHVIGYIIDDLGDTLYVDKIAPTYVFNRPESWKKSKSWRQYYRTVYNFRKTYPYALKAKVIIQDADSTLKYSNFNAREREKYLKAYEKRLFKEFEKPLSNMSINQGKMLIKLIDREVGLSGFYLIKNYRGGAAAGFWQGIAKLFGSDLKKQYDKFGEDKLLEELVQMYHAGTFDYLYFSMFVK